MKFVYKEVLYKDKDISVSLTFSQKALECFLEMMHKLFINNVYLIVICAYAL